jgi:hypothetical protein
MDDAPHQLVAMKPGEVRPAGAERGEAMERGPDREGVVVGVSACRSASLFAGGNAVDERLQGSGPPVADLELLALVALATEKKRVPMRENCAISGVGEAGSL